MERKHTKKVLSDRKQKRRDTLQFNARERKIAVTDPKCFTRRTTKAERWKDWNWAESRLLRAIFGE